MDWFAKGCDVLNDPRTWSFAEGLGCSVPTASGHLDGVYGLLARHGSELGNLADLPDSMIEHSALWKGRRGLFATVLRAHYQAEDGTLRKWNSWNGKRIAHAKKERTRLRAYREAAQAEREAKRDSTPSRTSTGRSTDAKCTVQQDKTLHDSTTTTTTNYLPPTRKKREPGPKGERVTWLTPIGAAWEASNGPGSFPYPQAARELEPLTKAGITPDEIARRLAWYLENKGSESVLPPDQLARKHFTPSLRDFRLRHGKFDPSAPSEAA